MRHAILTIAVFAVLGALFWTASHDGRLPWEPPPSHGEDWCEAHRIEDSRCGICNPKIARGGTFTERVREPAEGECPNTLVRVTLAPGGAGRIGIERRVVESRPVAESVLGNAESQYAPSGFARVAARIPGVVREVRAAVGLDVEAGAVLAVVASPDLGRAKSEYLQALGIRGLREKTCERERSLFEKKITAGRELAQAETELEEARLAARSAFQGLRTLGLTAAQVEAVAKDEDIGSLLEVTAPFAGTIVEAAAVAGENASPDRPLFAVADLGRLWISVDVGEGDLPKIGKGQRATFTVEGMPGRKFAGAVVAIGAEVDDRTRAARVYAEVPNPDGLLRARMFGRARIAVKPAEPRLLVPREAVQSDGDCSFVFVEAKPDVYLTRKVELGTSYEAGHEVLGGLVAGEAVVTTGSILLKSEVLRGEMGAG